jgi:serine/threonine protein phosphatase 1
VELGEAKAPPGMRLYGIGDVHGCDELLAEMHAQINRDLAARGVGDYRIVHVGDYVDRGPDSRAVIERLARMCDADPRVLCLRGNHDDLLLDFMAEEPGAAENFFANGGEATVASYGVHVGLIASLLGSHGGLGARLREAMPAHHRAFVEGLALSARFGDFFFCHAGIRPGVALDAQVKDDLIWIREGFLDCSADLGVVVVHGHTPTKDRRPDVRPNRIDIDTGAVFGGPLTCVAIEGSEVRFL